MDLTRIFTGVLNIIVVFKVWVDYYGHELTLGIVFIMWEDYYDNELISWDQIGPIGQKCINTWISPHLSDHDHGIPHDHGILNVQSVH